MNSHPKISIVIPSLNKVRFIGQTLKSIFDQKYPNLEVIIQDGGSTDGTLDIIKKFAKKHSEVKWESGQDKGQVEAINKGVVKAKGDILAFINADDLYSAKALDTIAGVYMDNSNALWFAGKGKIIDAEGKEIAKPVTWYKNLLLSLNSRFYLLVTNYLMQPSVFLTRKAYRKYGPFTGTAEFVMEYDLWLKLSKIQMPSVINKYLSSFRIGPGNITKQKTAKLLKEDGMVVRKHTSNLLILFLHRLHNLGRILVGGFI